MSARVISGEPPQGRGSVHDVPGLSADFTNVFSSRWVHVDDVRLHTVTGGEGPPLLLIAGWPQCWYAWRKIMVPLAHHFTVVVPDTRGVNLSDKPVGGYDTATLAADMAAVMRALGYDRFHVAGHDVGMWIAYALASDQSDRVDRVAVAEAVVPGLAASPPLIMPKDWVNRLYHLGFNRLESLNEQLVEGREELFFGHQFATKAARPLDQDAIDFYIEAIAADREALRACFDFYRAIEVTVEQNQQRATRRLTASVLTIAGAESNADLVARSIGPLVEELTSIVIEGCGHYVAEESPEEMLHALGDFLQF
jgi:pimeloyl-ACP methyl ester carboxylesterase